MPRVSPERNEEPLDAWLGLQYGGLEPGHTVRLPVLSASMVPYLVPGGQITIQRLSWQKCRVGDIVVYRGDGRLTAHRLLFRLGVCGEWFLYQKGQRNPLGEWIRADRVVGVVVGTQGVNGEYVDLSTDAAKRGARECAHKQLVSDLRARIWALPRALKRRLKSISWQ
jgi:hypothetical protein